MKIPSIILLLVVIMLIAPSCKKSKTTTFMSTATILGQEPFLTACDAKYWIRIDDSTAGRTFDTLPAGSGINPNFPTSTDSIKVKVNWHNTGVCARVVIDAIELVH